MQHSVQIECEGGAAGTQRSPWPVPSGFAGRVERFEIYSDVIRPEGAGDLIKQAVGKPVEPTSAPGNQFLVNLFMAVVARHVLFRPPATVEVFIPANASAEVPGMTSPQDLLLPFLMRSPSFWFLVIFLALAAFAMFWPR